MNLIWVISVASLILAGDEARAEIKTDLTISSVKVIPMGDDWQITVTGRMSLSADDTLKSYRFFFTNPVGKEVAPVFGPPPFSAPKPGESSTFTCVCTTHVRGGWSFGVEMEYSVGGKKDAKIPKMEKFGVPPEK